MKRKNKKKVKKKKKEKRGTDRRKGLMSRGEQPRY